MRNLWQEMYRAVENGVEFRLDLDGWFWIHHWSEAEGGPYENPEDMLATLYKTFPNLEMP